MGFGQSARRWLYRGKRPGSVARFLNRVQAQLAAHGIGPARVVTLDVRGRRTGRTISLPVVVADYHDGRYLVSMFGDESPWVRNVRAAGGEAAIRHRTRQPVHLDEVPVDQRPPILKRYLAVAPGRGRTSRWIQPHRCQSSNTSPLTTRCSRSPAASDHPEAGSPRHAPMPRMTDIVAMPMSIRRAGAVAVEVGRAVREGEVSCVARGFQQ
jgi:hypothetical protein